MNEMIARMSPRERVLSSVVGGILFLLINLVAVNSFLKKQTALRVDLGLKQDQWKTTEQLLSEHGKWIQRDQWLKAKQPVLKNEGSAGVELLDQVKQMAKNSDVVLENPAIGSVERNPTQKSVFVTIETKSSWSALIAFLQAMQQPDQFIVFENALLEIDPSDATRMRGSFRISRWYAP